MITNNRQRRSKTSHPMWGNIFKTKSDDEEGILTTLRLVPLFANMSDGELREFEKLIHRRTFKANETIFWEGEPGVGMYIIQRGTVAIFKHAPGEGREELATLRNGEFFGELALLDESPRSATAVAKEPSDIIGLFRPDLFELLERKPRLGNKFLFQLALIIGDRLKNTNVEMQALRAQLDKSGIIV
ncbi:MAG: cyclic nucleotide-binding domain-containing protein [candidate division KSB1 bacterium]|nr:cyclic nucleotide-binding domain-containing protein [candidate division KSB1 bacterium]MDZ7303429.1 cyclic nucleotide-binding domain-containing protein [candidate division KSB1 bacterium]MDZ7312511.1 cyclic nucleotide-binding domain-containing protein [candidate division KSB1 bacterium]